MSARVIFPKQTTLNPAVNQRKNYWPKRNTTLDHKIVFVTIIGKRAGLHRGELRIDHEGGVGRADHRHAVAADGGEIAKQRAEAVDARSVGGPLGAGLAIGGLGALGLGDNGVRAASALSSSSNRKGLRAWRMCHST
jgi:hypothetical protein